MHCVYNTGDKLNEKNRWCTCKSSSGWGDIEGAEITANVTSHLCIGLNAVTNFANFTIFHFSFKFNKFCDFSLTLQECVMYWFVL